MTDTIYLIESEMENLMKTVSDIVKFLIDAHHKNLSIDLNK